MDVSEPEPPATPPAARRDRKSATCRERGTVHLRERQQQRGISDEELETAKQHGERVEFEEDTVHYRYKGVSYVTVDGVGITAWRIEPPHCVCSVGATLDFDRADPRLRSNADKARQDISVRMVKAGFSGCAYNKPDEPGWRGGCVGCPQCRQHRTPSDPLAALLETIDFSKPGYGELLAELRGLLILCAAGSLLVPVRCPHCHGIKRLKRRRDGIDESDAVRWITFLLRLDPIDKRRPTQGEGSVLEFRDINHAGGCTPAGAAAKAGHFRCLCTLLRWGADPAAALMDLSGPCAHGHTICLLECKAKRMESVRQHFCCAHYDECIGSLKDYQPPPDAAMSQRVVRAIAGSVGKYLELMAQQGLFPSDDFHGFAVDASFRMGSRRADGSKGPLGQPIGLIWDGYCYRILLKAPRGEALKAELQGANWSYGEPGTSYASSYGFTMRTNLQTGEDSCGMHVSGIENVSVKEFLNKKLKQREGSCGCQNPLTGGICPRALFGKFAGGAPRQPDVYAATRP